MIKFSPKAGQIFICDFKGFEVPEMVKTRPVIVISPKLPHRSQIVTIVPISLTPPIHKLPFAVNLAKNYSPDSDDADCWAKCDMIMNLRLQRLSGFKIGRRKYTYPQLTPSDLQNVKSGVLSGLGFKT